MRGGESCNAKRGRVLYRDSGRVCSPFSGSVVGGLYRCGDDEGERERPIIAVLFGGTSRRTYFLTAGKFLDDARKFVGDATFWLLVAFILDRKRKS